MKNRVLLIEDDPALSAALKQVLESEDYEVEALSDANQGLTRASGSEFDVVVTDLQLPGLSGLELIEMLHAAKPHLPVILMTAHHTTDTAIKATKLGAFDYILKPFDPPELLGLIQKAATNKRLTDQPVDLGEAIATHDAIIGSSRVMQDVYKAIGRVAAKSVTVLVRGETGTGKELVARAIYQHSDRAGQPFIVVNCVAIPETLLESELFGHEQGAFTGANARRIGRFEQAHNGTIFLDEIGDMSMSTQAKLLRVLQDKTIQRLAGKETISVDVRIIAATHRDLEQAIQEKAFREDLYYRLNVAAIHLPPLRDRAADIPALAKYLLQRHGAELGTENPVIDQEAVDYLQQLPWPGNVRELENVIRKALLLARGYAITRDHIHSSLATTQPTRPPGEQTVTRYVSELLARAICGELKNVQSALIWDVERELYMQAIQLAQGNQAKAAKWLGVSRPTMREKLTHYGLRTVTGLSSE